MKYWIWLQSVLLEGSYKVTPVLERFETAKNVYDTDFNTLKSLGVFSPNELERIKDKSLSFAEKTIKICKKNRINILNISDDKYPNVLRNIPNPPLVLYTKGELIDFDNSPVICIVGPRKVSDFGKKSAYSLGLRLAKAGITVVSGGAVGSDTAAHVGTLEANGKTVAVLPCGILNGYLVENKNLRDKIAKTGCLLSEYPPEKGVGRTSFKVRNRLLAALSYSTVVVEAASRSGALITANYAIDYGKDLFVIPGNPTLPHYKGSNALLRDCARPLLDTVDILNIYISRFGDKIDLEKAFAKTETKKEIKKDVKNFYSGLSKTAKMLYNNLDRQIFSADDLLDSGVDDDELLSALTELEMEHLIKSSPGGFYEKI